MIDHLEQATLAGLQACCFQEMRKIGSDCEEIEVENLDTGEKVKWLLYWSGHKKAKRDGVAIAIRKTKSIHVRDWCGLSARLMWMDLTIFGLKIRITCGYAPTNENPDSGKMAFYSDLKKATTIKSGQQMACGDFNATGLFDKNFNMRPENTSVTGLLTTKETDNGKIFSDFVIERDLTILNTCFNHPKKHRDTWEMKQKEGRVFTKCIDYMLSSRLLRQYVRDTRVRRKRFDVTDHYLLVSKMATPNKKSDFSNFTKKTKKKRYDLAKIRGGVEGSDSVKANFMSAVDELTQFIEGDDEVGCTELTELLNKAVERTVPTIEKTVEKQIWDDDLLRELKRKRADINRFVCPVEYKELIKQYRRRVDQLRNKMYDDQAAELNFLGEVRKIERQYKKLKTIDKIGKTIADKKPDGLKDHFKNHFNGDRAPAQAPDTVRNPPEYIKNISDKFVFSADDRERLKKPPDRDEIRKIVKNMKSKKAFTDVAPEILKLAIDNEKILDLVDAMMQKTWTLLHIPDEWRKTVINPLFKNKGSRSDCGNWRGLAIGSTFLKVCMSILLERTSPWYNATLHPAQTGFRKGYGCSTATYNLHTFHHVYKREKKPLLGLFLDFKAAYDWLGRQHVFQSIYNRCGDNDDLKHHFRIIEALYELTKSRLSDDEDTDLSYFETTLGLRQGGSESPSCYNLYADTLFRVFEQKCLEKGIGIRIKTNIPREIRTDPIADQILEDADEVFVLLGYADDTICLCESLEDLQAAADIMTELLDEYGLRLSVDKTKSMEFLPLKRKKGEVFEEGRSLITMKGEKVEHVQHFKYLGSFKTDDEPGISNKEISYRTGLATGKFNSMKHIFCNHQIKLKTRIRFYDCFVKSRLLYSCETWCPTQQQVDTIEAAHIKFLRFMVKGGWNRNMTKKQITDLKTKANETETKAEEAAFLDLIDWSRRIRKPRILEICQTTTLVDYMKKQNKRFLAHQFRMPDWTYSKKLTFPTNPQTLGGRRQKTVYEKVLLDEGIIKGKKKRSKPENDFLLWCKKQEPDHDQDQGPGSEVSSGDIVQEL